MTQGVERPARADAPEVSVVVPTFNRATSLRDTLDALEAQTLDHSRYEVIVVDDCSADDTGRVVAELASRDSSFDLRYVRHDTNRMKATACNTGIRQARGEFVAFTDDDIRPVPQWLEAHLRRHRSETRELSVTGLVLYPESWEGSSNWVRFANDNYRKSLRIHERGEPLPPNRFAGGNSSLRRETLLRVGGFDEGSLRSEDITMGCQLVEAGVTLVCEPQALAYHYAEVILSIDRTLSSFRRSYEFDMGSLHARYPWYFERYGHWFVDAPRPDRDAPSRRLIKVIVRLVAHRAFQRAVIRLLKAIDRVRPLYWKPLYQYVMVCEAVDAVRASRKAAPSDSDSQPPILDQAPSMSREVGGRS